MKPYVVALAVADVLIYAFGLYMFFKDFLKYRRFKHEERGSCLYDRKPGSIRIGAVTAVILGVILIVDKCLSISSNQIGVNVSGLGFLFVEWVITNMPDIAFYEKSLRYAYPKKNSEEPECELTPDKIASIRLVSTATMKNGICITRSDGMNVTIKSSADGALAAQKFGALNNIDVFDSRKKIEKMKLE